MHKITAANQEWWSRFKDLLDGQNEWPTDYIFKFIVPRAGQAQLTEVFGDHPVTVRASNKGRYVSVTATMEMTSSDDVIRVYREASQVEGVISL
jgi:hypothetical protein